MVIGHGNERSFTPDSQASAKVKYHYGMKGALDVLCFTFQQIWPKGTAA
jgi:hypothetical protein